MYRLPELGHGPTTDAPLQSSRPNNPAPPSHPTRNRILNLLADCPNVEKVEHSDSLEHLLLRNDLECAQAYDLTFSCGNAILLVVNPEVWREPVEMRRLRAYVSGVGDRFVLLPKAIFSSSSPSGCLADLNGLRSRLGDRIRLLLHLIEHGTSTLFDCACVTTSHAPVASVLQIAAEGFVDVNLDASIGPDSPVSLPALFQ